MHLSARRSLLFAPAHRAEYFAKAAEKGADIVCLECEDAVPASQKKQAREAMVELFATRPSFAFAPAYQEYIVRINGLNTADGQADLEAVLSHQLVPDALLIPKIEHAEQLVSVDKKLQQAGLECQLMVLIETAQGLENAASIVRSTPRLSLCLFGGVDLAAELGCEMSWMALLYARQRLIQACALARLDVLDMPSLEIAEQHLVAEEAEKARQIGFKGKAAIHPSQLDILHHCFTPAPEQIEQAKAICAACEAIDGGAGMLDGRLIEKPVLLAAQKLLARAHSLGLT